MAGFNFGQIGPILNKYMDTAEMDIGRKYEIILPDGSPSVADDNIPLYTDVPCAIYFNSTDNPNITQVGTDPIIVSITIACDIDVDLQNQDLIHARQLAHDGTVLEEYVGRIGMPQTIQSRKEAIFRGQQVIEGQTI